MRIDLKEIEEFLTKNSGYRKEYAVKMIISRYKLTGCDAIKIYNSWRKRFIKKRI